MSAENDLALAYHMGYDDALGKRMPDASKTQVLAPYDLADENAKLRERVEELEELLPENGRWFSAEVVEAYVAEIKKLRELVARMAEALGIDCEWADPNWCKRPCALEFGCWPEDMAIRCPAWAAMRELGVEVDG